MFLPLIELNTSVPQEGCLHHCYSLHGKPLSVSNSETSQQELFVGEPCCFWGAFVFRFRFLYGFMFVSARVVTRTCQP